jgi:hypothetical protein
VNCNRHTYHPTHFPGGLQSFTRTAGHNRSHCPDCNRRSVDSDFDRHTYAYAHTNTHTHKYCYPHPNGALSSITDSSPAFHLRVTVVVSRLIGMTIGRQKGRQTS